ncbi:MAG TPA: carboxypeptidase-like regulatory domain-containing protein [Gemmatimonadaceae bacterium]|nr:carboxypeptidase-like regulatory domain-containing protein [Gemmatimonadaceae bacterium]
MSDSAHTRPARLFALVLAPMIIAASGASSQEAGSAAHIHQLAGVVTDARGFPLPDAEVTLDRRSSGLTGSLYPVARTSADGTFSFSRLEPGSAILSVRRVGHHPYRLGLLVDTVAVTRPVRIALQAIVTALDTVRVLSKEGAAMQEFNARRRTRGSGVFIDRREIERRRAAYTSDLLRAFPGIGVRRSARGGNRVRVRNCRPAIFIDGTQALDAELDDVTRPADIEGIEAYRSWAGVPPQFSDRSGKSCGAILVWTRIR